jgi:hypothetical protein
MDHARGVDGGQGQLAVDGLLLADRDLGGLAPRDLHGQQEVQLEAGFVQDIGHAVGVFGQGQGAIAQGLGRAGTLQRGRPLPGIDQGPDRNAAVDDVLAVVAGVVPAGASVQGVVAAGPGLAALVG